MSISAEVSAKIAIWRDRQRIARLASQTAANARPSPDLQPVIFFNASARLGGLSQNAAFALLASTGLRLAGLPIVQFICQSGMSHCVLGTDRRVHHNPPPCSACIRQSERLYAGADVHWFRYAPDLELAARLHDLNIEALCRFELPLQIEGVQGQPVIPLGSLVLPSLRWALRRHTLPDDEDTCYLLREYILSAHNVAREFGAFIHQIQPKAVVIFNGILYPEAAARWVALKMGVRVITHEVGFQRFSAFFSDGEATAYPIHIPEEFELTPEQDTRLDAYLENRFQGKFSMAGIRFWPEMRGLDQGFLDKAASFRQIVAVFTNVIYDTSQVHANQVFPHMFAWLDLILEIVRGHPETLFVIRAHPDEMRPGTAKQSRESVHDWIKDHAVAALSNVVFIDSQEYVSSYELIQRAKFVMVYNSSIGMEAALMGAAVLCGGKARYTQYPMVFFPETSEAYRRTAEEFLTAEKIHIPAEFRQYARRFLYYQLFRASLSFEDFLVEGTRKGYVGLRPFSWHRLAPGNNPTIRLLADAISGAGGEGAFLQEDAVER